MWRRTRSSSYPSSSLMVRQLEQRCADTTASSSCWSVSRTWMSSWKKPEVGLFWPGNSTRNKVGNVSSKDLSEASHWMSSRRFIDTWALPIFALSKIVSRSGGFGMKVSDWKRSINSKPWWILTEVTSWCIEKEIPFIEKVGHTLWNPHQVPLIISILSLSKPISCLSQVIKENGGTPPLTFSMFNHVVKAIGDPDRPLPDVDLNSIPFAEVEESLATNINLISGSVVIVQCVKYVPCNGSCFRVSNPGRLWLLSFRSWLGQSVQGWRADCTEATQCSTWHRGKSLHQRQLLAKPKKSGHPLPTQESESWLEVTSILYTMCRNV